MSATEDTQLSPAERNWLIVRDRLCARIRRQTLALARLAGDPVAVAPLPDDPTAIADAETLLARLEQTEQQLDGAFAKRALRVGETAREPEKRNPDMHAFQSR